MLLNKKSRACITTFILLTTLFSVAILTPDNIRAEESELDSLQAQWELLRKLIDFDNPLSGHPYRTSGVWDINKTIEIKDDMTFDLYFSSTLVSQMELLNCRDSVNISVYHLKNSTARILKNGTANITLEPELFDEKVQQFSVTLKNVEQIFEEGDQLLVTIEIIPSDKPIKDYVEKNYDRLMKRLEQFANLLKKSNDDEIKDVGLGIEALMENLSSFDIGGEEFGTLISDLRSSAFYYGSSDYSSSIKFSSEADENFTLYLHNDYHPYESNEYSPIRYINSTEPTGDILYAWPPTAINSEEGLLEQGELFTWILLWAFYNVETVVQPDENMITYYLHDGNKMDTKSPTKTQVSKVKLSKTSVKFDSTPIERNIYLKNMSAELYIHFPKIIYLGLIKLNTSIYDNKILIASDEKMLDRSTLLELIQGGPDTPTRFSFNANGYEITHDHNLTLKVTIINQPLINLRSINLFYDSENYPSSISVIYEETDNLKISEGLKDKKVYAGGSAEYILNVTSKYEDTVDINIGIVNKSGGWTIEYHPEQTTIPAKDYSLIHVYVNSTATDASAYKNNDFIKVFFEVSGLTGITNQTSFVRVSKDAVVYDIEVISPQGEKVKHGSKVTYQFIIRNKNKGYIKDRYNIDIISENDWKLDYISYIDEYLNVYDEDKKNEAVYNITVQVPWYTETDSDLLSFTITSEKSPDDFNITVNVTTKVEQPNIFENIYHMFESAAEDLGLNDVLGEYGAWLLIFIVIFIIVIFLVAAVLAGTKKFVNLICLERIKEISPDETATFEITIENIYKHKMIYELNAEPVAKNDSWDISLNMNKVELEPEQSIKIKLTLEPNDNIKPDDWVEVKITTKPTNKKKTAQISMIALIKDAKVDLRISGVFHWPKVFKKGERVETSFKIFNRGNVSAEKVSVILYVNGEEKNKVENITIPRGGYADIEMPWIAVKGKNEVNIVVK